MRQLNQAKQGLDDEHEDKKEEDKDRSKCCIKGIVQEQRYESNQRTIDMHLWPNWKGT